MDYETFKRKLGDLTKRLHQQHEQLLYGSQDYLHITMKMNLIFNDYERLSRNTGRIPYSHTTKVVEKLKQFEVAFFQISPLVSQHLPVKGQNHQNKGESVDTKTMNAEVTIATTSKILPDKLTIGEFSNRPQEPKVGSDNMLASRDIHLRRNSNSIRGIQGTNRNIIEPMRALTVVDTKRSSVLSDSDKTTENLLVEKGLLQHKNSTLSVPAPVHSSETCNLVNLLTNDSNLEKTDRENLNISFGSCDLLENNSSYYYPNLSNASANSLNDSFPSSSSRNRKSSPVFTRCGRSEPYKIFENRVRQSSSFEKTQRIPESKQDCFSTNIVAEVPLVANAQIHVDHVSGFESQGQALPSVVPASTTKDGEKYIEGPFEILDMQQYFDGDYDVRKIDKTLEDIEQIRLVHKWANALSEQVKSFSESKCSIEYFVLDEKLMLLIEHLDKLRNISNRKTLAEKLKTINYIKGLHELLDINAPD